jgi:hypothetical protein
MRKEKAHRHFLPSRSDFGIGIQQRGQRASSTTFRGGEGKSISLRLTPELLVTTLLAVFSLSGCWATILAAVSSVAADDITVRGALDAFIFVAGAKSGCKIFALRVRELVCSVSGAVLSSPASVAKRRP